VYKCQKILEKKLQELTDQIKREMKLDLQIRMFRDYMVKIELINEYGDSLMIFNLYYSPKKNSFRIVVESETDRMMGSYVRRLFLDENNKDKLSSIIKDDIKPEEVYCAYTDGSYLNGAVGYGAVLLREGEIVKRFSGQVRGAESLRQVAGELQAVLEVLDYCEENEIEKIKIFYDYTGVREWAVDNWQANKELTKAYKNRVGQSKVIIVWEKVTAHSGDHYNEMADRLAKKGTHLS